jgi:hypothetical protein
MSNRGMCSCIHEDVCFLATAIYITILSSCLRLCPHFFRFPYKVHISIHFLSHACYIPCPYNPIWLGYSSFSWREVQVMESLIKQTPSTVLKGSKITKTNEGRCELLTATYLIDVDEIPRILQHTWIMGHTWGTHRRSRISTAELPLPVHRPSLVSSGMWRRIELLRSNRRMASIFKCQISRLPVVGLERGPLSLLSTTEELLEKKVAAPV